MKNILYLFMLLFVFACSPAFAVTYVGLQGEEFGLNRAAPEQMQKNQLGTLITRRVVRVLRGSFDFAKSGGNIGAYNLTAENGQAAILPKNAIVTNCAIDVITAGTSSSSGTIALGTGQSATDLKAATAAASYTGLVACVPVGTVGTAIKMTADRTMTATIATGNISQLKLNVLVQYILSDP